jgi:hypothetical protein
LNPTLKKESEKKGTSLDIVSAETDLDARASLENVRSTLQGAEEAADDDEEETKQMQPVDIKPNTSVPLKSRIPNSESSSVAPTSAPKNVKKDKIDLAAPISARNSSDSSRGRFTLGNKKMSLQIDENKEMEYHHLAPPETEEQKAARIVYEDLAKMIYNKGNYKTNTKDGKLPSRSPYTCGRKMSRGANFTNKFKEFVESGGIAKHKDTVVMNVR